ncbi:hypothetical protein SDC9_139169 [bioreactor metagenome]|uniref:Uncharacterized protein n=1 Tax=bioreactor metagenome TaxID=1076179 RepID=A0A645DRZ3_9ZZZZ
MMQVFGLMTMKVFLIHVVSMLEKQLLTVLIVIFGDGALLVRVMTTLQ